MEVQSNLHHTDGPLQNVVWFYRGANMTEVLKTFSKEGFSTVFCGDIE